LILSIVSYNLRVSQNKLNIHFFSTFEMPLKNITDIDPNFKSDNFLNTMIDSNKIILSKHT